MQTYMCVLAYIDTRRINPKFVEEHGNRAEGIGTGVKLFQIGFLIQLCFNHVHDL